ncbi:Gfo/Idh/MocA family oxidoreductase [Demequina sp. TTPB684]|uniref:Gfo/Idh/MocA family protein n=1 Tax=unclassified Demequina TaxID=2620311 RepID=UPI001CF3F6A1|nr:MULTISPECIES: Gfo/Idh/MocA family oxidoreductase [unclassified Demequina]MCB2413124.1 Gfo/Idh/MocA family oxidoreductase [Demequina sp. TTPB684]UPU87514.1 Gfo/Idh/MocA family oxidoreductase [Demequina sp. TMPB413]
MSAPDPMTAPSIRWGILGAGGIAAKFADAVRDYTSSDVVAVSSASSLDKAKQFVEAHDAGDAVASYAELVARDDVDAVYVATTHNNHHEPAILAIEAGKHVLVEKAFAQNSVQTEAILAAAEEVGVFVMEAMWTRHLPHIYELRTAVAAGEIGDITCIIADHGQALTHVPRMYRADLAGGALLDLGVYPISFAHTFLGVPDKVTAVGQLTDGGVDNQVAMIFDYPNAQASLHTSMVSKSANTAQIIGTKGRIEVDGWFYVPTTIRVVKDDVTIREFDGRVDNGFQFQAAEVARGIAAGLTESPIMPWKATREVMALMDLVRGQIGLRYPNEQ